MTTDPIAAARAMIEPLTGYTKEMPGMPGYWADGNGDIWSVQTNWRGKGRRKLAQHPNRYGYMEVRLTLPDGRKKFRVHRLVALAFHGVPKSADLQVRHLNGIRTDNRPENLCWGSVSENALDRQKHGTEKIGDISRRTVSLRSGELCVTSKLTNEQAATIQRRFDAGEKPWHIAKDYPAVTPWAVNRAARRKTFNHV